MATCPLAIAVSRPLRLAFTLCVLLAAGAEPALAQATYPPAYRELKLPELAGATVTSTGRQSTSLRDGIRVEIETTMEVQPALDAYRATMTPLGWKETPPRNKFKSPMVGITEFTRGDLTLGVNAMRLGPKTKITLSLLQK